MRPRAGFLLSFAAVAASRACLRLFGFGRSIRLARWLAGRYAVPAGQDPTSAGDAAAVVRAVAVAAAFFPGRAVCLEQSLAGFVLLRRAGFAAQLRVGVQPLPFEAHAWLELDGRPLLENEDELIRFVAFPGALA